MERLFQQIRQLGLERRGNTPMLMRWALAEDPPDESVLRELEERVREEEAVIALNPDPFRASTTWQPGAFAGSLRLGKILQTGSPYALNPMLLRQHILVLGRTRGGKTTVIRKLLSEVLEHHPQVRVLILERKREFTDVARRYGFRVATLKTLKINPLRPPRGVAHHVWVSLLAQQMIDYLDIMMASSSLILEMCGRLYDSYGVRNDWDAPHPHLGDLRDLIAAQKFPAVSHNARYQETSLNRINELLNTYPGMFECDRGFDVSQLPEDNVLTLLHDMPHLTMQNFLISFITTQLFVYQMSVRGAQPDLRILIIIDEGGPLFRRVDEVRAKPSYLGPFISQAAAFGIGAVVTSQFTSDLAHAVLGNTSTKILVGGFERGDDTHSFMSLRPHTLEQEDVVKSYRRPGHAFISDIRHARFLECEIEEPELPPPMTDAEIDAAARQTADHYGWPAGPTARPPAVAQKRNPEPTPTAAEPPPVAASPKAEVDHDMVVLADVERTPFEPMKEREKRLGIKGSSLDRIVKRLEAQHLIAIHLVHHRPGAPRHLYEVTEEGYRLLGKVKPKGAGKGGYLHQFYQREVSRFLTDSGFRVTVEGRADDKLVDVIAAKQPEGETIAVEIELHIETSEHFIKNLEVDLRAPRVNRVVCLVPTKEQLEIVQRKIAGTPSLKAESGRIQVDLLRNYMRLEK